MSVFDTSAAQFDPKRSGERDINRDITCSKCNDLFEENMPFASNNLDQLGGVLPLLPGTVDIWLALIEPLPSERIVAGLSLMSDDELHRHEGLVSPEVQLQHLTTRVLVRTVLSLYANAAPERWRFESNAFGRPAVVEPETGCDLRFNVSHTDGLVALAVAKDRDVGIDVEQIDREIDVASVAPSVMGQAELEALETTPPGQARQHLFFALWTLKEAYIKARGEGLSLPLNGIAFDLLPGRTSVAFNTSLIIDDATQWLFQRFAPTPLHALAVAAKGPLLNLRTRWITLA